MEEAKRRVRRTMVIADSEQREEPMRSAQQGEGFVTGSIVRFEDFYVGRAALRVCLGARPDSRAVFWRINGYRAKLLVWTAEEWEELEARPSDAQLHPSGVWCALRLEEAG
jgi:hypothetical protein